ncbi:hypothetical protein [Telluria beijingensis]|uniref:hypothetical protein n=1 Tax=Telluria beijingensis TaxID=3068633 RepID=UPI0027952F61|nr:hypothetical protein [Massilia sp. REN29]
MSSNHNPAYFDALANSRGIALPAARTWSILLTSANHGTVGPIGSTFPHAGEKHERVQVMEIVEAGAPPAPGADLAGLVRVGIDWSTDFLAEVRAHALEEAAGLVDAATEGSLRSATSAAIRALKGVTPTATNTAGAVPEGDLRDLARQFQRAASRDVPLTISPESCALLFRAMTPPIAPALAEPVHQDATLECDAAFERWYAAQRHQLTNEQVCHLIWQRAWEAASSARPADVKEVPSIESREFHEMAMDYRGASITGAHLAYRALLAHIDAHVARHARPSAIDKATAEEARLYRDLTGDAMKLGFDGLPAAVQALRDVQSAPAAFLLPGDMKALARFCECAEDFDSGGHDVPKEEMRRLVEIGVTRPAGPGRHMVTSFGDYVMGRVAELGLMLPLKTLDERNQELVHRFNQEKGGA